MIPCARESQFKTPGGAVAFAEAQVPPTLFASPNCWRRFLAHPRREFWAAILPGSRKDRNSQV